MNKEFLRKKAQERVDTNICEDLVVCDRNVDFMAVGSNGIFICLEKEGIDQADIEWYEKINQQYAAGLKVFLYTMSADPEHRTGSFYAGGGMEKVDISDDIYADFQTSYDFAATVLAVDSKPEIIAELFKKIRY